MSLLLVIILFSFFYIGTGRLDRYLLTEVERALNEYGLRTRVGALELDWGVRTVRLRDVTLENQVTGAPIATIERAEMVVEVRDMYALRLRREIIFKRLSLDGVLLHVNIDERGRSNLTGLHEPPPAADRRITFDLSTLNISVLGARLLFNDRQHDVSGRLTNLSVTAQPSVGEAVGVKLVATAGDITSNGRTAAIDGLEINGSAGETAATIESLGLRSQAGTATGAGRIDYAGEQLRYDFQVEARINMTEAGPLLADNNDLRGQASFTGRIEGADSDYRVSGALDADDLLITGTRARQLRIRGLKITPQNSDIIFSAERLAAAAVTTAGALVNNLNVADLRANYRDSLLRANARQANAGRVDLRQARIEGVTMTDAALTARPGAIEFNGAINATGGLLDVGTGRTPNRLPIGRTQGRLVATADKITLGNLAVDLLGGSLRGELVISPQGSSRLAADFTNLDTAQLLALAARKRPELTGTVSGKANISWPGTDARALTGMVDANFTGATGTTPLTGMAAIRARGGVFLFENVSLNTEASTLTAAGTLSPRGASNLRVTITSSKAEELQALAESFGFSTEALIGYDARVSGDLNFTGTITGPLENPTVEGDLSIARVALEDDLVGSLSGRLLFSPAEIRFENGVLMATNGGSARFTYVVPRADTATSGRLDAQLDGIAVNREQISGEISGEAHITGLPAAPRGSANISLAQGTILGQRVENLRANLIVDENIARLETGEARLPQGQLSLSGQLNLKSEDFQLQGRATEVDLARLAESLKAPLRITGSADATFLASGNIRDLDRLTVELRARGENVTVDGRAVNRLDLTARTSETGRLDIELVTDVLGRAQPFRAAIELRQPGRPLIIESDFTNFDIAPLLTLVAPDVAKNISGSVTGRLRIAGPTERSLTDALRGTLVITDSALRVAEIPIAIETPATIAFNGEQAVLERLHFTGEGTDLVVSGTIPLRASAEIGLSLNGSLNLVTLSTPENETYVGGAMTIDARIGGTLGAPRLGGAIELRDLSYSALDLPVAIENGSGRVRLEGDRAVIESFAARANDGTLRAIGNVALVGLKPSEWEIHLTANDVDIIYQGALATLDGNLTLSGTPQGQELSGTITIPQAEYAADIDLGNLSGGGGINLGSFDASGGSAFNLPPVRLNVRVEARNSLLVRSDQLNTVASAGINLSGTINNPEASGRITFEGGTIRFRGQRYEITTGAIDLPPGGSPAQLTLLAEGDVSGYHLFIGFNGPVDSLDVTLRAEPDLTRAEILALITTGRTDPGLLGGEQLGDPALGTAALLLSEELLTGPLGRGAQRLLGISRFQIDPILRPDTNPAARVTIGQQITRDLSITYSTNLSSEQQQTVIAEYLLSNRFSAIASYSQTGGSTRTGINDNEFTIDFRGRERFSLGFGRKDSAGGVDARASIEPPSTRVPVIEVTVDEPPGIDISKRRQRELLPIIEEGFSRPLARLGARNLLNYLQERGYFFASVTSRCEPEDCSGPVLRVHYQIDPGQRFDLEEIRIEGTELISKSELDLQSQVAGFLGSVPLFKQLPFVGGSARGITSNDRLRRDRDTIRRRMNDLGFRGARVSSRLAFKPDSDDLVVIFVVEEGPRATVDEIVIEGNALFSDIDLRAAIPLNGGDIFSPTNINEGRQSIRNRYTEEGYLDAAVETEVVDIDENRVRLIYRVNEGVRVTAGEIVIAGLTKTKEDAVRRFLSFAPGDVLTPSKIQRTQRDLYATGAFREVNVRTEPMEGEASARRVIVNVTEAKPLLVVYGLGYSTDEGPRTQIELSNVNLFGLVNSGSLKFRLSRSEQFAQLQFINLRPFGYNWPTTISGFYERDSNLRGFIRRRLVDGKEEDSSSGRSFGVNRFAAFIQTERKLDERTSLRLRYSFQNSKLFNLEDIPLIEIVRNERAIRLGLLSFGLSRDTRDSAINPRVGELMSVDYSIAARLLGGNESFNKIFGNYQRYEVIPEGVPLLGGSVFAFSARIGLAAPFSVRDSDGDGFISDAERQLPISERFFAGGATTLRGFAFEKAGPQAVLEPRAANELPTLVPLGGDALTIFNFELRYPLTRRLELVPFYDLGNVFKDARDISFGTMTNSIGLGLRIRTPIGPVGIDYGYLLDPPAFVTASGGILRPRRAVIHIRFGQTF